MLPLLPACSRMLLGTGEQNNGIDCDDSDGEGGPPGFSVWSCLQILAQLLR